MSERAPLPCPEMQDIREQIDALDKRLVALLAERQKLIAAAGKVKPSRDMVRDEARIEEVEPVWRQLIERSIAYEYGVFDKR